MTHKNGYLILVLHAHLPFVRHPEYPEFLEEDWFFEAITETYLPLLEVYEGLWNDGVRFRVSMTMSPPLLSMFNDGLLRDRYSQRLRNLIRLASEEQARHTGHLRYLAGWYRELFEQRLHQFEDVYQRDLTGAFRKFQDRGALEILTCGATHGFLPLMQNVPEAVNGQVQVAIDHYWENFGRAPRGIWLPECGYYRGLDTLLNERGIRFFIGETHAIGHAVPRPERGVYAPIYTPSGVAVFARDQESSQQVWSAEEGYPGHPDYREFYRDVGFDAPFEHVRPYVQPNGHRKMTGIKYQRITGKTNFKEWYYPDNASRTAEEHAGNFAFNRQAQVRHLAEVQGRPPVLVAPYDAELYGHWWFEGPQFLNHLFRKVAGDFPDLELTTPSEYLRIEANQQVAQPNFSTWGENGYADVWAHPRNDWIYKHLLVMSRRMRDLARRYDKPSDLQRRALNQCARELLLAQSSDWAFIMKNDTSVDYAVKRTNDHISRFNYLWRDLDVGHVHEEKLHAIEIRDTIFPNINYRVYA